MADCLYAYYAGSAQISATEHIQKKNGYIKLIVATREVDGVVFGTNKQSSGELKHGHTNRPNYSNPRCACAPRVNEWNKCKNHFYE